MGSEDRAELRVLVLAPAGADARVIATLLEDADLEAGVCSGARQLARALEAGAGAAVVAEEALGTSEVARVAEVLAAQPEWSDLPLILLTLPGHESGRLVESLWRQAKSHVTVLERPIRAPALLSTVRMALQSRRRQYQVRDELERRLAAERALAEAHRRKDHFLAALGHELRGPLGVMTSCLELLRRRGGRGEENRRLGIMGRQLGRLTRLVDDLLDVSRITHGKLELRRRPVALAELVEGVLEAVGPRLDAAGHHFEVDRPGDTVALDADALRLEQVLVNLLTNAIKYTPPGGHIELGVEVGEHGVRLRVRDDGVGLPPEKIDSLFEMFEQLEDGGDGGHGGLGIGLALSRRLVEMHGGRLEARSEGRGKGSEFTAHLPAELVIDQVDPAIAEETKAGPAESTAAVPSAAAETPPTETTPTETPPTETPPTETTPTGKRHRVLIAEDDAEAAEALASLVESLGHQARVAGDGPAAVESVADFRPHLALVDIGLPGFDGYEVARRLGDEAVHRPAIVAALTGWGQERDRRRAFEAGFDRHLTKPLAPKTLESLLAAVPTGGAGSVAERSETEPPEPVPSSLRPAARGRQPDAEELGRLAHGLRGALNNMTLELRAVGRRPPISELLERTVDAGRELAEAIELLADEAETSTSEGGDASISLPSAGGGHRHAGSTRRAG